jgi:hypothetical protein
MNGGGVKECSPDVINKTREPKTPKLYGEKPVT